MLEYGYSPSTKEVVAELTEVYGNTLDFSEIQYTSVKDKLTIGCKKHGWVESDIASLREGRGCPLCSPRSRGESIIAHYLDKSAICYQTQKRFKDCKKKSYLPFDFYISKWNVCIEYQGEQHYRPVEAFGGESSFRECQENDEIKRSYCRKTGIKLIEIAYWEDIREKLAPLLQEYQIRSPDDQS